MAYPSTSAGPSTYLVNGRTAQPRPIPTHHASAHPSGQPGAGRAHAQPYPTRPQPFNLNGTALDHKQEALPFFDLGPFNRVLLSLRSAIDSEVDWALRTLLEYSFSTPNQVVLPAVPGLVDALLSLVGSHSSERQRAKEALLVLRNLAAERGSTAFLVGDAVETNKTRRTVEKLKELICDILEGDEEKDTELMLNALDILEVIATTVSLHRNEFIVPIAGENDQRGSIYGTEADCRREENSGEARASDEALSERSRSAGPAPASAAANATNGLQHPFRLYDQLVRLTESNDRALLLSAYRCLAALAANEANETFFCEAVPVPLNRAITLLPLLDLSFSITLLDFIYVQTSLPSIAQYLCASEQFKHVLRLLLSKLGTGLWKEEIEFELRRREDVFRFGSTQAAPTSKIPNGAQADEVTLPIEERTKLSVEELELLANEPEPRRTIAWLHYVFESHAGAEIAQVSLWNAYRLQFSPVDDAFFAAGKPKTMLAAQEVIKKSSIVFPSALAMVSAQNAYVISNLRVRERKRPQDSFRCRWRDCASPEGPASGDDLRRHIETVHLDPSLLMPSSIENESGPTSHLYQCGHYMCPYAIPATSRSAASPALASRNLAVHARIHVPSFSEPSPETAIRRALDLADRPPDASNPISAGRKSVSEDLSSSPPKRVRHTSFITEFDANFEPVGVPLLSALVLRNIARCVREATDNSSPAAAATIAPSKDVLDSPATSSDITVLARRPRDADEEEDDYDAAHRRRSRSFFPQSGEASAANASMWWGHQPACLGSAKQALIGIEKDLLRLATEVKGIDGYLAETLACIALITESEKKKRRRTE